MEGAPSAAASYQPRQVKLIFNPSAGATRGAPVGMVDVVHELQALGLAPEVFLLEPDCDLPGAVQDALARGIDLFVVCGGDGTISAAATALAGTRATLGIVPAGTRNNVALSLGIPQDVPAAVETVLHGRLVKMDIGIARCNGIDTPFLEVCSVGLTSALFPSADDIQHGDLTRVGDFLGTLVASPPSEIHLVLDDDREIREPGHIVLVSNTPFVGPNYPVGAEDSFCDGLLDVLLFAELSKLDLLGHVVQGLSTGWADDERIHRYQARCVTIDSDPVMAVMADGNALGESPVRVEVRRGALAVMVGYR